MIELADDGPPGASTPHETTRTSPGRYAKIFDGIGPFGLTVSRVACKQEPSCYRHPSFVAMRRPAHSLIAMATTCVALGGCGLSNSSEFEVYAISYDVSKNKDGREHRATTLVRKTFVLDSGRLFERTEYNLYRIDVEGTDCKIVNVRNWTCTTRDPRLGTPGVATEYESIYSVIDGSYTYHRAYRDIEGVLGNERAHSLWPVMYWIERLRGTPLRNRMV